MMAETRATDVAASCCQPGKIHTQWNCDLTGFGEFGFEHCNFCIYVWKYGSLS